MTFKRIAIGCGLLFAALIALVAYQWLGPSRAVVVSPQTTFVTGPLSDDGLPNFAAAILKQQSEGVTRDNNGAVPFYQAMGPGDMTNEQFAVVCLELGLEKVDVANSLVSIDSRATRGRLAEWVVQQRTAGAEQADDAQQADDEAASRSAFDDLDAGFYRGDRDGMYGEHSPEWIADELWQFAADSPWTAADLPPLADWVAENGQQLDLLREAGVRRRFYMPSPSHLERRPQDLISTVLPGVQLIRSAARSLSARSMFYLGNGDYEESWRDVLACYQLGDHAGDGWTLVADLVGMAVRGVAAGNTLALLNDPDLPRPVAEQVLRDLKQLADRVEVADSMDFGERLAFIDSAIRLTAGRDAQFASAIGLPPQIGGVMSRVSFDTNLILRKGNKWYDKLQAAVKEDDYAARRQAIQSFETELSGIAGPSAASVGAALLSRRQRSELTGDILIRLLLPAISAASEASDRDEANMTLIRTAAALAVYRMQHGEYPESLAALAPELLDAVPIDLFTGKPLTYERRGQGYLLYSVGANGTDEGGDDELGNAIVDGQWVDPEAEEYESINHREGDYVIRMPMPAAKLPEVQLPEEVGD